MNKPQNAPVCPGWFEGQKIEAVRWSNNNHHRRHPHQPMRLHSTVPEPKTPAIPIPIWLIWKNPYFSCPYQISSSSSKYRALQKRWCWKLPTNPHPFCFHHQPFLTTRFNNNKNRFQCLIHY